MHSLGKESGTSRLKYISRFYRYIFSLRQEYDVIFVHMNSEYVVLGGAFWRLWGKRIVLWRNHKVAGFSTWLAAHIVQVVCYTSPSAYVRKFRNAILMPIGIDTNMFVPSDTPRDTHSILFFGRLDEVKHPDVFVRALEMLHERGVSFTADIVGDPTDPVSKYAHTVRNRATTLALEGVLQMHPAIANQGAPELFGAHAIYVNLTPSGSFDKTIGEAAASGCIVVAANVVLRGIVPDPLIVDPLSAEDVARGMEVALDLGVSERAALSKTLRDYVVHEHSLTLLVGRLMGILRQ